MKTRTVDFVNKQKSGNDMIGQGHELNLTKNPNQVKAYGTNLTQKFGTYDKENSKMEIFELDAAKFNSTKNRSAIKNGVKRSKVIGSSKENENPGPDFYKKTDEFYVQSPVKQSYVKETSQHLFNTANSIDQQNEVIRRRNEVEDYYDSLRRRTDVDYNSSVHNVRNNMRGLPLNEYATNRSNIQQHNSMTDYMMSKPSMRYERNYDNMNSQRNSVEKDYQSYYAPPHSDVIDVYQSAQPKVELKEKSRTPKKRNEKNLGKAAHDINHRGDKMNFGASRTYSTFDRGSSAKKYAEEEFYEDADERFLRDEAMTRMQVENYDRVINMKCEKEKLKERDLQETKPYRQQSKEKLQKIVSRYYRDQEGSDEGADSYLMNHVQEVESIHDDYSSAPIKQEPVQPKVKNARKPKESVNIPQKSHKGQKNNMPLKKEDKALHPKAKKYREIMEKKKAKEQETTYGQSYIEPKEAERSCSKRAKTRDLSRSKSTNMETEYRQDFVDPAYAAHLKGQSKKPIKSKTRLTEYLQEFKGNSQTKVEIPIEKSARKHDKLWQDGQGETEYRKDYVDPKYTKNSKITPTYIDHDGLHKTVTTYRQDFEKPKGKKAQNESTSIPIKVDTRTEYRSEYPTGSKNLIASTSKDKHVPYTGKKRCEELRRSHKSDRSLVREKSASHITNQEKPVRQKETKKVITYKKKKSAKKVEDDDYQSTQHYNTAGPVSNEIKSDEQQKFDMYFAEQERVLKQRRNLQQSIEPELPVQTSERKIVNPCRNLESSLENPIDNWAYNAWNPSNEEVLPDPRKYKNNEIGMSYLVSKDNLGFSSSTDYLLRIAERDDVNKYQEYKQEYERAKEAANKTYRKMDKRQFEQKYHGLAGLPSNIHDKNQNYFIGEDDQNRKIDLRLKKVKEIEEETPTESLVQEPSESNLHLEEGPTPMESEFEQEIQESNDDFISER